MLIRIKYVDDRFDMVRPETLDRLLETGTVREFQRQDGWVISSMDTLRSKNRNDYSGIERRARLAHNR
jgi:hypothetical protein